MKLETSLHQRSYLYFVAFFLFMLVGFWSTYFTRILDQEHFLMHVHGVLLIAWCLMLVAQAWLIRANRRPLHRQVGKLSYVIVPAIVVATVALLLYKMTTVGVDYVFAALVLNALVVLVIYYGLAIFYRKNAGIHARFMLCTIFPMFTPITDRIIGVYAPGIRPYIYTIDGQPFPPVVGFAMADLILLGLCVWDWRSHKRWNAFPIALIVLMLYHFSVLNFYKYDWWRSFCEWLVSV